MKTPFNEDDHFQSSTMSFGEHLEELRRVLIKALYGLAICMILGFLLAPAVVRFFKVPIEGALEEYYRDKGLADLKTRYGGKPPLEMQNMIKNLEMVPEYQKLEISEFMNNLRESYPGQFDSIQFSPYTIVPADFETIQTTKLWQGVSEAEAQVPSAARFARRWQSEGEATTESVGNNLWKKLSEEEQTLVREVATQDDAEVSRDDKRRLALLLNRFIQDEALYTEPEFEAVSGTSDTKPVITEMRNAIEAGEKPTSEEIHRLNKLLLSSHFSGELRRPQLTLVDVPVWRPVTIRVQALNAQEAFMIWVKASFMTGLVLASPWIFLQIWTFVAAGLYPHEKNYVYMYLPVSMILFAAGAVLAIGFVFRPVLRFLFFFNQWMEIDPDPRIGEWLGFVLLMPLAFGLSFQLPLVMLFLNRIGLVDIKTYLEHWRVSILIIAVAAMIITPGGDPYSMLLMMTPLIGLYFLGIGMCRWMPRGRNPFFDEVHEP